MTGVDTGSRSSAVRRKLRKAVVPVDPAQEPPGPLSVVACQRESAWSAEFVPTERPVYWDDYLNNGTRIYRSVTSVLLKLPANVQRVFPPASAIG